MATETITETTMGPTTMIRTVVTKPKSVTAEEAPVD